MGGNDKDVLSGGTDADRFVFKALDESVVGVSHDVITDFKPAQKDIIDVSAIDAIPGTGNNAFDFIGSKAFTKASGEVRYFVAGNQTLVQFDYDGDARADMEIALTGNIALTATDFYL
jgi:Ca2+-binding RTX toxin-like protein